MSTQIDLVPRPRDILGLFEPAELDSAKAVIGNKLFLFIAAPPSRSKFINGSVFTSVWLEMLWPEPMA